MRVTMLGRFSVMVDGVDRSRGRKTQRRPLDLLSVIVALGGDDVHRDAVTAALWPELDGAAARDAFEVTLHRLRKLLGHDEAVALATGKLQLSRNGVWTDVGAFEPSALRLLSRLDSPAPGDLEEAIEVLALYRGPLLESHEESGWLLPTRERIRSRYLGLIVRAGQLLEHTGNRLEAARIYSIALEKEPLAEELYRSLIGCLTREGRRAEALEVYRRCSRMLSIVLGLTPSQETENLRRAIYPDESLAQ